ncbi:hypothetical protein LTR10_000036 [Elasticomyces elasticus]|nr:hypothetical protein LTR10_000036 [Elasticomyces elasticus]KAK4980705.1 hypothetical protein LTR42_001014 [Elasticomyces elasticus]
MNLVRVRDFAPNVAVLRTSRLVRHESYTISKELVAKFFSQRDFFVEVQYDSILERRDKIPDLIKVVAAQPLFPISALTLKFLGRPNTSVVNSWCARISAGPGYGNSRVVLTIQRDHAPFEREYRTIWQQAADKIGVELTRHGNAEYLDPGNLVKAFFSHVGG